MGKKVSIVLVLIFVIILCVSVNFIYAQDINSPGGGSIVIDNGYSKSNFIGYDSSDAKNIIKKFSSDNNQSNGNSNVNIIDGDNVEKMNDLGIQEIGEKVSSQASGSITDSNSLSDSYIIEFKDPSIIEKQKSLDDAIESFIQDSGNSLSAQSLDSQIQTKENQKESIMSGYKSELESEHSLALKDIQSRLSGQELPSLNFWQRIIDFFQKNLFSKNQHSLTGYVLKLFRFTGYDVSQSEITLVPDKEFYNVFNGVVMKLSLKELAQIKQSEYVKEVYPNLKVHASLMDSVPLINADDVWKLDSDGNNCITSGKPCLTGKNITVAVIDTGIDYTHPDLGGANISNLERKLDKINNQPISVFDPNFDQEFVLKGNKLAYYSKNTLYLYNFDSKVTQSFNTNNEVSEIVRMGFENDTIAYYGSDTNTNVKIYIYNTISGQSKNISGKISDVEYIFVSNGNVVYYNDGDINIYNIQTGQTSVIHEQVGYITVPAVDSGLIAYSVGGIASNTCYDKAVIYNISSKERKEIFPTDIGTIFDIKGDKIIYRGCSRSQAQWTQYHLYNFNTGEDIILSPVSNGGGGGGSGNAEENQTKTLGYGAGSYIMKGAIGDGIVYFSKDLTASKIMAYDINLNRYVQINAIKSSGAIDADGKKICFISGDIYCHDYNSSYDYSMPTNVFNNKVVGGYDFVNYDNDPMDDMGHGTHVAGIVAGNGQGGLKGVAPDAKLYAYKVLDSGGSGSFDDVIAGIDRAVDPNSDGNLTDHLDVISMSLGADCGGTYSDDCGPDDPVSTSIDNAVDAGVVAVIAAGNSGPGFNTIGTPGTARNAITVGASDKYDNLADFSSKGPVTWKDNSGNNNFLLKPDLTAPGVDICSAEYDSAWSSYKCLDDKHVAISGTSMATPHVAGAVALLKQSHPSWSPQKIKSQLENTAKDINPTNDFIQNLHSEGHGRIDVLKADTIDTPVIDFNVYVNYSSLTFNLDMNVLGSNLKNYSVYYKQVDDLQLKTLLSGNTFTHQIKSYNISSFDNGDIIFKIEVYDNNGNLYYKEALATIENIRPYVLGKYNYLKESQEKIYADVKTGNYTNYSIYLINQSYGAAYNPILIYSANSPLISGEIGTINVDSLSDGKYNLIIKARHISGVTVSSVPITVIIFKELRNGMVGFSEYTGPSHFTVNNIHNKTIIFNTQSWIPIGGGWYHVYPETEIWNNDSRSDLISQGTQFSKGGVNYNVDYPRDYSIYSEGKDYMIFEDIWQNYIGSESTYGNRLGMIGNNHNYINSWPSLVEGAYARGSIDGHSSELFNSNMYSLYEWDNWDLFYSNYSEYFKSQVFKIFVHDKYGNLINNISFSKFLDNGDYPRSYSYSLYPQMFFMQEYPDYVGVVYKGWWDATQTYRWLNFSVYNIQTGQLVKNKDLSNLAKDIYYASPIYVLTDDLDKDNKTEIIIGYSNLNETLYNQNPYDSKCYHTTFLILDTNGTQKYPIISYEGYMLYSSPIITENNSKKYIVASLSGTYATGSDDAVVVFNLNGSLVSKNNIDPDEYIGSLVSGDVDNDNNTEIAYLTSSRWWGAGYEADIRTSHARIISLNGTLKKDLQFYSKNTFDTISNLALSDYNNDGKLDLTALGSSDDIYGNSVNTTLYNIDLGYSYNPSRLYWPMASNNLQRNNCYNCKKNGINSYLDLDSMVEVNSPIKININIENNDNFKKNVSYIVSYSYCNFSDRNICAYQNISVNNISVNQNSRFSNTLWFTPQSIGNYVFKLSTTEGLNNPVVNYYSLESLNFYSYLDAFIDYNRLSSEQENDLWAYIYNYGNENSIADVSLYYQKGYCDDDCNNLTLISDGQYTINRDIYKIINYKWTPDDSGYYTLVLKLNSSDNINTNTEFKSNVYVIGPGPDVAVNFDYNYNGIFVNQENNITIDLSNQGTEKSSPVDIFLYDEEKDNNGFTNYNLIGEKTINGLNVLEEKMVNFSWTPEKAGSNQLYVNISSSGDVYDGNNYDYNYYNVVKNETDLALTYLYVPDKNIVNQEGDISVSIENLGKDAYNANLSLYINDKINGSIIINELYSRYSDYESFYWKPNQTGNYSIRAEIKIPGDTNLTNNVIEKNAYVYALTNVSFHLQDSSNNPVAGYLVSDIFDKEYEYINGTKNLTLLNLAESKYNFLIGFLKFKDDNISNNDAMGVLFNSSFENNIVITTELYNKTSENGKDYYMVFANKISTKINNNQFVMQKSLADLSAIGLNDIGRDYDLFYCTSFDFSSKKCSVSWKQAIISSFYNTFYNNTLMISVNAYTNEPAEAFGFSNFTEDICGNLSLKPDFVDNLVCERNLYGKINFKGTMDLTNFKSNPERLNRNIRILDKDIYVNTKELTEFQDIPADILLKNINFISPKVLYNGALCPPDICSNINYDSGSNTLTFSVAHFSEFQVVEGCGDSVCSNLETCGTCPQDCGQCSQPGNGGGGSGGGGGGSPNNCIPKWNCTEGLCINGIQNQICTDLNKCGINLGKPTNTRLCLIKSNCIDNDKDGYGVGPDCLGPDLNDNDPSITDKKPEINKETPFNYLMYLGIFIVLAVVILIILIIIRKFYSRKAKNPLKKDKSKEDTIKYTVRDVN